MRRRRSAIWRASMDDGRPTPTRCAVHAAAAGWLSLRVLRASSARARPNREASTAHDAGAHRHCDDHNARRRRRGRRDALRRVLFVAAEQERVAATALGAFIRAGDRPRSRPSPLLPRDNPCDDAQARFAAGAQIPIGRRGGPRFSATEFLRRLAIVRGGDKYASAAS